MKIKNLLTILSITIFLSGCEFVVASKSSDRNNTAAGNNSIAQLEAENQQSKTRPNSNQKVSKPSNIVLKNEVCPVPAKPCHHREKQFDDWELSFRMPARLKANVGNESTPFWAIIIKKYGFQDCDGGEYLEAGEQDRKRLQAVYPDRKVFADYECPNMAAVSYNFAGKFNKEDENIVGNFIAVYAGETKEAADELLKKLQEEYPEAEIKKMTAVYEKIVQ
jgi:hypothetical protein